MAGKQDPRTIAVANGIASDEVFGTVTPPIYLSSTFAFSGFERHRGYEYSRTANPGRDLLADTLAKLEGGAGAVVTASGMAAVDLVLSPSNPLMRVVDIRAIAAQAKKAAARVAVDNTFLSPALQRPIALGADLVIHSTTKYINGHSDVVGGAVVCANEADAAALSHWANVTGSIGSPFDAYLTLRGVRTLFPRIERQQGNAAAVAPFPARSDGEAAGPHPGPAWQPRPLLPPNPPGAPRADVRTPPSPAGQTRCGASSRRCGCSRWPNRWAGWRASSPIRPR